MGYLLVIILFLIAARLGEEIAERVKMPPVWENYSLIVKTALENIEGDTYLRENYEVQHDKKLKGA